MDGHSRFGRSLQLTWLRSLTASSLLRRLAMPTLAAVCLVTACDDSDSGSGDDTSAVDTSTADDTMASDTVATDTAVADTAVADTGSEPDTATPDTDTLADTAVDTDTTSDVALVDEALDGNCPGGALPGSGVAAGSDLHKVTLDAYPEAICNDGTPAIMYVRRAANAASEGRWVIHMQAGGNCSSHEVCLERWCGIGAYDAAKMSSRFAPEATRGSGIFARTANNAFGGANQVYLYYCSSDSWVGQRSDAVLEAPDGQLPSFRLHFRGHDILEAAADALRDGVTSDDGVETLPPLSTATDVLFTGSSAGSNGLSSTLDWWAQQVPQANRTGGVFDSIFLPLVEDVADPQIAATYELGLQAQWTNVRRDLYDAFADESCLAMHPGDDAYLCGLTTHVQLHHTTTPYFTRQDLTDRVSAQYLEAAGANLAQIAVWTRATLERVADVPTMAEEADAIAFAPGSYSTNCGQHIVLLNDPWFGTAAMNNATVENLDGTPLTLHDALAAWIGGEGGHALDTHPSTVSQCAATTDDQ